MQRKNACFKRRSDYQKEKSREKITNPYINDSYIEVGSSEEIRIDNIAEAKYIYIYAEDLARKYK